MAALSSLYTSVKLYAQQCPESTIDKYLIEAIRTFCRDSWYYQATLVTDQVADQAIYTITPVTGEEVVAIQAVEQDGQTLSPLTQDEIGDNSLDLVGYQFEPPYYLNISPTPTTTIVDGLEIRLVLMPPEDTTTLPDSVYRNYKETIVQGALAHILSQQNEAWSNPNLAEFMLRKFRQDINIAKGERQRDFRSGPISVKPRPFLV